MKITDIKAIYPKYQKSLGGWRPHLWQIVVRIETDAGVVGWGYGGGGQASLPIINGHFRDLLLDRPLNSIADISAIWDDLYHASIPYGRKGVAIMALSGVDLALWDLLGKAEGMPVYQLIAQQTGEPIKERVRCYASGRDSDWYAEQGITAQKFPFQWKSPEHYDEAVRLADHARQTLAPGSLIMFDGYMTWDETVTHEMAKLLADFDIYWFEDVATPDELGVQVQLRDEIKPVLLAGGEHEFTRFGFADIARTGALDIWQPDVTWCGGITSTLRIIEQAVASGAQVCLHRGGEVWGLHVIAASACDNLAELLLGNRTDNPEQLWRGEPTPNDGHLHLSDAPGFGVTINEEYL